MQLHNLHDRKPSIVRKDAIGVRSLPEQRLRELSLTKVNLCMRASILIQPLNHDGQ